MARRAGQTDLAGDRPQAHSEIRQFILLPHCPFEAIVYDGARDMEELEAARVGEAKGGAIQSTRFVIECGFLGVLARQQLVQATGLGEGT